MFINVLEAFGVFAFCLSGAVAGRDKQFDLWGMFVLALVTGAGGGTLRSVLTGDFPVPVLLGPRDVILAVLAVGCAVGFPRLWGSIRRKVAVIDAIGLGLFAGVGTQLAADLGLAWWAAVGMGVVSATFGGVIRDVIRNEIPLVFRKEIYATAAMLGGLLSLGLQYLGVVEDVALATCIVFTATVRLLAIRFSIHVAEAQSES